MPRRSFRSCPARRTCSKSRARSRWSPASPPTGFAAIPRVPRRRHEPAPGSGADVLDFVAWLREHDDERPEDDRVGFYGLDLYSLHASIEAILAYLERVDPSAAARARERYACFDHARNDSAAYGYAAAAGLRPSCEEEVVAQLLDLRRRATEYARQDGRV